MIDLLEDDSTIGSGRALIDLPGPQNLVVVDWAAATVQGRRRLRNEDNWTRLGSVFAVADGMGGLADGDQASAIAVREIANQWFTAEHAGPGMIVRQVNEQIRDASAASDATGDSGCTLSALRVAHDQATIVQVGDSRIYRLRGTHAELLTRDQNLRSELLASGITPGSERSLGPLRALTSYLGKPNHELQIDVRSVSLRAGDRLVLCTDGVFDEVSHGEFSSRAGAGAASFAANRLTALLGSDDATALVLDIGYNVGVPATGMNNDYTERDREVEL